MPRKQTEDVNQSARQLAEQEPDDARQTTGGRRQRPEGMKKDRPNRPSGRKRTQSRR